MLLIFNYSERFIYITPCKLIRLNTKNQNLKIKGGSGFIINQIIPLPIKWIEKLKNDQIQLLNGSFKLFECQK